VNRKSLTLAVLPLLLADTAFSQFGKAPQLSPELKKLDYFVGTWKTVGQMKPSPMGPAGTFTSTDHYEWQKGNFFLIGHSDFKSRMGDGVELSVLGYDPASKLFIYHSFSSAGEQESATGTLQGNTWTWNAVQSAFRWRYIQKVLSPTSLTVRLEATRTEQAGRRYLKARSTRSNV
jgi:hypothetical protein